MEETIAVLEMAEASHSRPPCSSSMEETMSTQFEKLVARRELIQRRMQQVSEEEKAIQALSDTELQQILEEPDEPEPAATAAENGGIE